MCRVQASATLSSCRMAETVLDLGTFYSVSAIAEKEEAACCLRLAWREWRECRKLGKVPLIEKAEEWRGLGQASILLEAGMRGKLGLTP